MCIGPSIIFVKEEQERSNTDGTFRMGFLDGFKWNFIKEILIEFQVIKARLFQELVPGGLEGLEPPSGNLFPPVGEELTIRWGIFTDEHNYIL